MRTKGSSRFDDYFKVQTWDGRAMCWRDIQKAHPTIEAAVATYPVGEKCRVMRITEKGRAPIELAQNSPLAPRAKSK